MRILRYLERYLHEGSIGQYFGNAVDFARRNFGKAALSTLATAMIATACTKSAPAPEINCESGYNYVKCYRGGETALLVQADDLQDFSTTERQLGLKLYGYESVGTALGNTVRLIAYVSPDIARSGIASTIVVYDREINKDRSNWVFASIPLGKEVTLPFKPNEPDCYRFYLPDVKWNKTNIGSGDLNFVVGRHADLSLKVSSRGESYTISGQIENPSRYSPTLVLVIEKHVIAKTTKFSDPERVKAIARAINPLEIKAIEIKENPFNFEWVPPTKPGLQTLAGSGVIIDVSYKFRLEGQAGHRCEYIWSESETVSRR